MLFQADGVRFNSGNDKPAVLAQLRINIGMRLCKCAQAVKKLYCVAAWALLFIKKWCSADDDNALTAGGRGEQAYRTTPASPSTSPGALMLVLFLHSFDVAATLVFKKNAETKNGRIREPSFQNPVLYGAMCALLSSVKYTMQSRIGQLHNAAAVQMFDSIFLCPEWNQQFVLPVRDPQTSQLECTLWDDSDANVSNLFKAVTTRVICLCNALSEL